MAFSMNDNSGAGLHFFDGGEWFSVVHDNERGRTLVDGSAAGINATAAMTSRSVGFYWERLRDQGSFGRSLLNLGRGE